MRIFGFETIYIQPQLIVILIFDAKYDFILKDCIDYLFPEVLNRQTKSYVHDYNSKIRRTFPG